MPAHRAAACVFISSLGGSGCSHSNPTGQVGDDSSFHQLPQELLLPLDVVRPGLEGNGRDRRSAAILAMCAPIPYVAGDFGWGRVVALARETDPAADQKSPCRPEAFCFLALIQPSRVGLRYLK